MSREVSGGLESLKITNDELGRLKKAFGDPEFRRLFKEYADEISDPENRRRYEEEIRTMELEQGVDVEFVNPLPGHCLKTRHWPALLGQDVSDSMASSTDNTSLESTKVFINVCKSDKVGCPVMKPLKNNAGKAVPNGLYWSLPHCFTPPHEDLDKNKKRAMVYDVAFHPKAFELASTSAAMRRLLNVTAVEGVQRQFNLCLGKTAQQAVHLAQLIKSACEPFSRPTDPNSAEELTPQSGNSLNRNETIAREEAILRAVHTLKGTAYKGMARPAVIRRRRADYERCQAERKRRAEEELQACTDPVQREAISKLSQFPPSSTSCIDNIKSGPTTPTYSITYSSDFDLINCRDAPDVNPIRPPDRLRVSVKLPGLVSSSSVDLELTATNLSLRSEKPVAYELELKLPYEVDDSKGVAQFDKSTSTLQVTVPLKRKPNHDQVDQTLPTAKPLVTPTSKHEALANDLPSIAEPTQPCSAEAATPGESKAKKKRRKKNRRRHSSASDTSNDSDTPVFGTDNQDHQCSDQTLAAPDPLRATQCVNLTKSTEPGDGTTNSGTDVKPSKTESHSSSETLTYSVPVTHVGLQQLIVSKDRRLAPVRFRQDPSSISIVFCVRGIVPESLVLHWASPMPPCIENPTENDDDSVPTTSKSDEPLLLLLFNFASRGAGGCTMDWGVVVRCPSTWAADSTSADLCREKFHSAAAHQKQQATESDHLNGTVQTELEVENNAYSSRFRLTPVSQPPRVISADFSATNAVIVLAKPTFDVQTDSTETGLVRCRKTQDNRWWFSVATGRTLNAGMQECPFEGVEGCLMRNRRTSGSATEKVNDASTSSETNDQITAPGHVRVNSLCSDCCEIIWSRTGSSQNGLNTITADSAGALVPNTASKTPKTGAAVPACNGGPRSRRVNAGFTVPSMLKGILKQRSYSESSGDEQLTPSGALRFAGLADTRADPVLSFDEFPTASSSEVDEPSPSEITNLARSSITFHDFTRRKSQLEGLRRCVSNEKLVSSSAASDAYLHATGRQRRRSVNFSAHDQHVDYSPRDTVETLHHTLLSRRKKARRRETRRRNCSGEVCASNANDWFSRKPNKCSLTEPKAYHFSGNNSSGEASCSRHSDESQLSKPKSLDDTGDHASTSGSSATSSPIEAEHTAHDTSPVSSDDHATCPKPDLESGLSTDPGSHSESIVPADQLINSKKRHACSVTLCAAPLFELDED